MFHFKLQQVLDYRAQLRDQAQIELARVLADYFEVEKHLSALEQILDESEHKLHTLEPNAYNDRWLITQCIKGIHADISHTQKHLYALHQAVEKAKEDLASHAKDHKILEKLKEKQSNDYVKKEKADEQRNFDESSSMRYKPPNY